MTLLEPDFHQRFVQQPVSKTSNPLQPVQGLLQFQRNIFVVLNAQHLQNLYGSPFPVEGERRWQSLPPFWP